jgi:hypothetical protein
MRGGERLRVETTVRRTGGSGRYYDCAESLHPCQKPLIFAERMIRAHLHHQPEHEIVMAISRAWRVLMGGGTLCAAIYRATDGLEPG